jgi:hypothetical protein
MRFLFNVELLRLFVFEGFYGIEAGSPVGWDGAEDYTDDD